MPKIMVVDDERLVRETVMRILQKEGYEVVDYPDAAPALEEADLAAIELILTDLNMPTPGEQLIQKVREKGTCPPIMVMSGHLNEEKRQILADLGVQAVLEKPFRLQTLVQSVQALTLPRQPVLEAPGES